MLSLDFTGFTDNMMAIVNGLLPAFLPVAAISAGVGLLLLIINQLRKIF
jgi:hypothetical protein